MNSICQAMKADLHVHSKCSRRPSRRILQNLGVLDRCIRPEAIYKKAFEKGMTFVTITDHNCVEGCLEIAHMPNVFISEEITTFFPDDGCKVHVLAMNITEAHHEEIQKLRSNIFELTAYLNTAKIMNIVAHPLFSINKRLTRKHFEQLLLLFNNFEVNGARDVYQNSILMEILSDLNAEEIERMANDHGITPEGTAPWKKNLTGGSDDHFGNHIAGIYTMVEGKGGIEDFLSRVNSGQGLVKGTVYRPKTIIHKLYSRIKADIFKRKVMPCGDRYAFLNRTA